MCNDRSPRFLTEFGCSARMVDVSVCDDNGFDIRECQALLRKHLFHLRGGTWQARVNENASVVADKQMRVDDLERQDGDANYSAQSQFLQKL